MDVQEINRFIRQHWLEISGLFTLGVSLWIAFGPLRHRLPRVLTRLGKYSATLKLLFLSGMCWFLLFRAMTDDVPSLALNWLLGALGLILFCGAIFVITRKQTSPVHHSVPHTPVATPPPTVLPTRASPSRGSPSGA